MSGDFAVSRWTGQFAAKHREEEYARFRWPQASRQLKIAATFGILAYSTAPLIDYDTFGLTPRFWAMAAFRATTMVLFALFVLLARRPSRPPRLTWVIAVGELTVLFSELFEYALVKQAGVSVASANVGTFALIIVGCYFLIPNTPLLTALLCTFVIGCFALFQLISPWVSSSDILLLLVWGGVTNTFGYLASVGINKLSHSDYASQRRLEREVTERILAERAAAKANEAKGRFLAVMSHEMRTPLGGILGGVELALATELPKRTRALLQVVEESAGQLHALVDDVLEYTRSGAERPLRVDQNFDLAALLGELHGFFELAAARKGLTFRGPTPLEATWVRADRARIKQILSNLLQNAIKFTAEGEVAFEAAVAPTGERLLFSVSVQDTGIGISQEELNRVFEPLFQGSNAPRSGGGVGLGLAISRQVAEAMGGSLTAKSEPGRGSIFCFEVALVPGLPEDAPLVAQSGPWRRLLLVDDSEQGRWIVGALLEHLGHHVTLASTGEEAVALALRGEFDLVLMDLYLPGIGGLEAASQIRSGSGAAAQVPIVALTADVLQEQELACREVGMQGFLAKPVRSADLACAIRALFEEGEAWPSWEAEKGEREEVPCPLGKRPLLDPALHDEYRRCLVAERRAALYASAQGAIDVQLRELEESFELADTARLRRAAHRLDGAAASFGMLRLQEAVGTLRRAAKEGQGDEAAAMAALREIAADSVAALEALSC